MLFKFATGDYDAGGWTKWARANGWSPAAASLDMLELTQGQPFLKTRVIAAFEGRLPGAGVPAMAVVFTNWRDKGQDGGNFQPYTTLRALLPEGRMWHNGLTCGKTRHGRDWYCSGGLGFHSTAEFVPHFDTPELQPLRDWPEWERHGARPNGQAVMTLRGEDLRLAIYGRPKDDDEAAGWVAMFDFAAAHARRAIAAAQAAFDPNEEFQPPAPVIDGLDLPAAIAAHAFSRPPSLSECRTLTRVAMAHRPGGVTPPPARLGGLAIGLITRAYADVYAASRGLAREAAVPAQRRFGALGVRGQAVAMRGPLPGGSGVQGRILVTFDELDPEHPERALDGEDVVIVPLDAGARAALAPHLPRGGGPGSVNERLALGCLVVSRFAREGDRTPARLDQLAAHAGSLAAWARSAAVSATA